MLRDRLVDDDLCCALGEDAERGSIVVVTLTLRGDGAHGLARRVERVDFAKRLFRVTAPDRLVVSTQTRHEPQQSTLGLVARLGRQAAVQRRLLYNRPLRYRVAKRYASSPMAARRERIKSHTHIHTQPFYGSVEFVRDNPGEPVPEETFTHSRIKSNQIYLLKHITCSLHVGSSKISL